MFEDRTFCVRMCVLGEIGAAKFFSSLKVFFRVLRVSAPQVFSALLAISNFMFKLNQTSVAIIVEVRPLLETAKACGWNPAGTSFFVN